MKKSKQLSLFTDKDVKRSPLCRMYYYPSREVIKRLRLEVLYNVIAPSTPSYLGSIDLFLLSKHRNGENMVKIKGRYSYDADPQPLKPI